MISKVPQVERMARHRSSETVASEVRGVCSQLLALDVRGTLAEWVPRNCKIRRDDACIRSRRSVASRRHSMTVLPLPLGNFVGAAGLVKRILFICQAPKRNEAVENYDSGLQLA